MTAAAGSDPAPEPTTTETGPVKRAGLVALLAVVVVGAGVVFSIAVLVAALFIADDEEERGDPQRVEAPLGRAA